MEKITFALSSSKLFTLLYSLMFLLTFFCCYCLDFSLWVKITYTVLLGGYAVYLFNNHIFRNSLNAVVFLWQDTKGQWGFETKAGAKSIGVLSGMSYVNRFFVILWIKTKFGDRCITIPRDAMRPRAYQLLCARLRFFTP